MGLGYNFLHSHPELEKRHGLDDNHCIVDRHDLDTVQRLLLKHSKLIDMLEDERKRSDETTNGDYAKRDILPKNFSRKIK